MAENEGIEQTKRRNKIIIIVVVCVLVVAALIGGIIYLISSSTSVDDGEIGEVKKRDVKAMVGTAGVIDSVESEQVTSQLVGTNIKAVYVKEGDRVVPGQIICQLDTSSLQETLVELQKSIAQARADKIKTNQEYDKELSDAQSEREEGINEINQQIFIAQVNCNTTQDELNKQRERYQQYLSDPNHSEWDMEAIEMESNISDLESSLEVNQSIVNVYQNILNTVLESGDGSSYVNEIRNSVNGVTDGTISSMEQTAISLQQSIGAGTVRCTVGGVITNLAVKQGDAYIGGGICTIENDQTLMIHTQVNEKNVAEISEGMKVIIKTDATGDTEMSGVVTYVAPRANSTQTSGATADAVATMSASFGSSGNYHVRVSLNQQDPRLRLGMNAKLSIITAESDNAISVPSAAIQEDEGGHYVEVITNMDKVLEEKAKTYEKEKIYVTIGTIGTFYTEIHGTGIKEDEYVYISSDSQKMYDALVKLVENYEEL